MIEFKNVFIKYINGFYSLYNFNQTFKQNTLIIGDATIGSKPILRIIAKIDKHYTGDIFINNINLKEVKDADLNVAFVPEKVELFLNKSVEKNLIYPLKIRKINKFDAKNMVFSILNEYNLESLLKIKTKKLNKSEQKIISLLRAVVRKPKYLLLEDFFKDLDPIYIELTKKIISYAETNSIIICCEETDLHFKNYKKLILNKN